MVGIPSADPMMVIHSSTCATGLRVTKSDSIHAPTIAMPAPICCSSAVEGLVEAQHVDGEPAIALAHRRRGAKRKDDDAGVDDARAGVLVEFADHAREHPQHHPHRHNEHDLLVERNGAQRQRRHARAEGDAAAQDAPVGRAAARWSRGAPAARRRWRSAARPARTGTPSHRTPIAPASPTRRPPRRCRTPAPAGPAPAPCRGRDRPRPWRAGCRRDWCAPPPPCSWRRRPRPATRRRSRSRARQSHRGCRLAKRDPAAGGPGEHDQPEAIMPAPMNT